MLGQPSCVARPHRNMETGFSVMRKDSIWVLKMRGTDTEGKDILQPRFSLFPWEKVSLLEWNEPTLIEQVKEFVILTELEDFAELLEEISEEMGGEELQEDKPKVKDESNPYN